MKFIDRIIKRKKTVNTSKLKKLYLVLKDEIISLSVEQDANRKEKCKKIITKIAELRAEELKSSFKSGDSKEVNIKINQLVSEIYKSAKKYVDIKRATDNQDSIEVYFKDFYGKCIELEKYLGIEVSKGEFKSNCNNILDQIKDPLSDDNLRKIIDIYVDKEYDDDGDEISFYAKLMGYGATEEELDVDKYKKLRDSIFKNEINKFVNMDEREIRKYDIKAKIKFLKAIYSFKKLKNEGKTRYERAIDVAAARVMPIKKLKKLVSEYGVDNLLKEYDRIDTRYMDEDDPKLTRKETQVHTMIDWYIRRAYHNYEGKLSFFIDRGMFDKAYEKYGYDIDSRFYINVQNKDLYEFTKKYIDEARADDLYFDIKVIDAIQDYPKRSEKLVIYTSRADIARNLDILRRIRKENPNFEFLNPPITAGTIDGWIGFGSEPVNIKLGRSYNAKRANILSLATKQTFKEIPKTEIKEAVRKDPTYIDKLRDAILEIGKKYDISESNFSLDNGDYYFLERCKNKTKFLSRSEKKKVEEEKESANIFDKEQKKVIDSIGSQKKVINDTPNKGNITSKKLLSDELFKTILSEQEYEDAKAEFGELNSADQSFQRYLEDHGYGYIIKKQSMEVDR